MSQGWPLHEALQRLYVIRRNNIVIELVVFLLSCLLFFGITTAIYDVSETAKSCTVVALVTCMARLICHFAKTARCAGSSCLTLVTASMWRTCERGWAIAVVYLGLTQRRRKALHGGCNAMDTRRTVPSDVPVPSVQRLSYTS